MSQSQKSDAPVAAQLSLFDAVSIIIGIVIGSSVFVTPSIINSHLGGPWQVLGLWTLGGLLSLIGALCYAELATAYPRMGGDYVYLTRAYGSPVGFLFGWANLAVILPSSIGMMAFVFGTYAIKVFGIAEESQAAWTVGLGFAAVAMLSVLNIVGVVFGKWTQNLLTLAKLVGLGCIAVAGLVLAPSEDAWQVTKQSTDYLPPGTVASFGTALILVLYAYGGWNDAAFVASEMRDRRKIPPTLILGTASVMVIYLLINAAYIQGLGFEGSRGFQPLAANVLARTHSLGSQIISVLVMVSALGAINGMLFTGARVCSALGKDHRLFARLGRWHPTLRSPVWAVFALAGISVAMILGVGTKTGRDAIDQCLGALRLPGLPWDTYFGGFDTLFAATAPVFWVFFLLAGFSVFVLRWREPQVERPFRVPFYPILPLIFCGACVFGIYSSVTYANWVALLGAAVLALGLPLYVISRLTTDTPGPDMVPVGESSPQEAS